MAFLYHSRLLVSRSVEYGWALSQTQKRYFFLCLTNVRANLPSFPSFYLLVFLSICELWRARNRSRPVQYVIFVLCQTIHCPCPDLINFSDLSKMWC